MKKTLSISYYTQFTRRETCLFFESNGGERGRERKPQTKGYTHIFVQQLIKAMVSEGAWHSTGII